MDESKRGGTEHVDDFGSAAHTSSGHSKSCGQFSVRGVREARQAGEHWPLVGEGSPAMFPHLPSFKPCPLLPQQGVDDCVGHPSLPAAQQKSTNGMHSIRPRSRMGTDGDRGGEVPSKNVWSHHVLQD